MQKTDYPNEVRLFIGKDADGDWIAIVRTGPNGGVLNGFDTFDSEEAATEWGDALARRTVTRSTQQ